MPANYPVACCHGPLAINALTEYLASGPECTSPENLAIRCWFPSAKGISKLLSIMWFCESLQSRKIVNLK